MKELPLKYAEETIIPDDIVKGIKPRDEQYKLRSGEVVTIEYRRTYCNTNGGYTADLDEDCQKLFGMSFERFRSYWVARIGRVSDYWHWVKLHNILRNNQTQTTI